MQIPNTQRYNQNFNGLIKFENITINPNHIIKSKVYTCNYTWKVNTGNTVYGYGNVNLQERNAHNKNCKFPDFKNWFEASMNKIKILINDQNEGLITKEFNGAHLLKKDKLFGFRFHDLKFLNMTGKIKLVDGTTYEFENASYLTQNPTLKEINIPINQKGDRMTQSFQPLTKNITSWDEIWSKAMTDDIIIDMNTRLDKTYSEI